VLLLDVTPLSLGVETLGGVMTKLIERNTTIPVRKTEVFSTAADGQTAVDIHVLQGEREIAADNMTLVQFKLEGIPPAPRGMPQIEVTFDIDANGILNVSAKDKATGKEQRITITASTNLTKEDVERMVQDASRYATEDRKQREVVDARNQADNLIYQMEKLLREAGANVNPSDRQAIEDKIASLKQTMNGNDARAIRSAMEELQQASYRLSERMYQGQQAQDGGGNGQSEGGQGEDVVEGEYRSV